MATFWTRLNGPAKVGLAFGLAGALLAGIGWFVNPQFAARTLTSFLLAIGISFASWGVVAWAIATAAFDVEQDIASEDAAPDTTEKKKAAGR
ncbi:MAG: hypothetical protein HZB53_05025 [Chloroflexi bacterium]|nr:hypothetical protein [Chloroflexota bacterium]